MDKENTIKTKVELDTSNAESNLENLNEAKEKSSSLNEKSAKSQKNYTKAVEAAGEASGGLLQRLKALALNPFTIVLTALVSGFKILKEAVNRSGKASETFGKISAKLGGIINGLLAVLEPVVEFLGEKLLAALNDPKQGIIDFGNAIKENIINRFTAITILGDAVTKLFEGDLKGAAKSAADALVQLSTGISDASEKVSRFGEEAKKNFNEAAEATEKLANSEAKLAKNRINLEKQQLISLRLAEEQRQIRDDESKSIEERIKANKKLGEILDDQLQKELALAQQALNLALAQQSATGDTIENMEAIGDAELKLLEIRERITGQRSEQLTNENSLLKEQAENKRLANEQEVEEELKRNENLTKLDELEIERLRLKGENTLALELELIERKRAQDLEALKITSEEKQIINEEADLRATEAKRNAAEEQKKINEESLAAEKVVEEMKNQVRNQGIDNIANGINAVANLFEGERELQKAALVAQHGVSIAKSIIDAQAANVAATAQGAALAIPTSGASIIAAKAVVAQNNISAGIGIALQGAALVKGLEALNNPKSGSKSSTRPTSSSGASSSASLSAVSNLNSNNVSSEEITDLSTSSLNSSIIDSAENDASRNISATTQGQVVFSESRYQDFRNQVDFREERTTLL